jgi:gliding motility-associated lipoprotein GldD
LNKFVLTLISLLFAFSGCDDSFSPKPSGYFRFDLPNHEYQKHESDCGISFDIPTYAKVYPGDQDCWMNLFIAPIQATVHISVNQVDDNLDQFLEDAQELVYKHTSKSEGIKQSLFEDNIKRVHGMLYELSGEPASAVQFYATDSTDHFIRGALYFYSAPNSDSLAPLVEFATEDIRQLISSIEWAK